MPLLPYFLNVRLVPSSFASLLTNWYLASPNSAGRFCPSSLFSSGLGSKVSIWLGPPAMNRKITDLALAFGHVRRLRRERIARAARASALQHGGEGKRAEAAECIGQKFAAVPGDSNVFGHGI